jgi:hypothetical protein
MIPDGYVDEEDYDEEEEEYDESEDKSEESEMLSLISLIRELLNKEK